MIKATTRETAIYPYWLPAPVCEYAYSNAGEDAAIAEVPVIKPIEDRIEQALAEQYDVPWPWDPKIKEIDNRILMNERRDCLPVQRQWRKEFTPLSLGIIPLSATGAHQLFLDRWNELSNE